MLKKILAGMVILLIPLALACAEEIPTPTPIPTGVPPTSTPIPTPTDVPLNSAQELLNDMVAEAVQDVLGENQGTVGVTGSEVNEAPVVRAWGCAPGWALVRLGEDAQVSDPDGDTLSYEWSVPTIPEFGRGYMFEDSLALDTFACLEGSTDPEDQGTTERWVFRLTVSDGTQAVADDVIVTVFIPSGLENQGMPEARVQPEEQVQPDPGDYQP